MGRPILAHLERVVREHVDDRELHERGEPDRGARVITENQEGGAKGPHLAERHPIQDAAHRVLADAEVKVASAVAACLEIAGPVEGEPSIGRRSEVGRAADQPGHVSGDGVEHLPGRLARGHALRRQERTWAGRDPSHLAARGAACWSS